MQLRPKEIQALGKDAKEAHLQLWSRIHWLHVAGSFGSGHRRPGACKCSVKQRRVSNRGLDAIGFDRFGVGKRSCGRADWARPWHACVAHTWGKGSWLARSLRLPERLDKAFAPRVTMHTNTSVPYRICRTYRMVAWRRAEQDQRSVITVRLVRNQVGLRQDRCACSQPRTVPAAATQLDSWCRPIKCWESLACCKLCLQPLESIRSCK